MLDLMRKHARNWIMKVLLGIIIVVFVFYFGTTGGKQQADTVASIDGKAIAYADVAREYERLISFYRQRFGEALNDEIIKQLNLKQAAMDNLIHQTIIMQKAREMRLTVSDEEVRASILAMPAFQRGGAFDEKIYQQSLRFNKLTPEDFELIQKNNLITSRFLNLIQDGVKVSDEDVLDLYRFQNEKVNLQFALISPASFRAKANPTQQDLEAYLKEHGASFRIPERIRAAYLLFPGEAFAAGVKVSDEAIADYYSRNADQFKTAGGKRAALEDVKAKIAVEIRRIGGMQAAAEAAKKARDTVYQDEDFEGYAAKNKLPVNTTGLFAAADPPAGLSRIGDPLQTLFNLNKDEISRVLSDQKAYYLFKITARQASETPALKDVRAQVESKWIDREADRLARQEAETLLASMKQGKALAAIAADSKLNLSETGFFPAAGEAPKLGSSRELHTAVFQLTDRKPAADRVFPVDGKYALIQLKERAKPDDRDFAAQRENLKQSLLQVRRNEAAKAWIEGTKTAMIKEGKLKINKDVKDIL
jgi:peptidyl-prolyl cis-trans isomerase D